jgi:peptide/nickel transport system substrate-binding protein
MDQDELGEAEASAGRRTAWDRRDFLGLTGAAALAAALPGRALAQAAAQPKAWAKAPVNFVYVNSADPNSLDPAITTLYNSYDTVRNVYDALVWIDEAHSKVVPWLASSFETSKDGRTHTFHIRNGVYFHDGSKLNAHVVQQNMQRYIALGVGNDFLISDIGRVTATGPMTVRMTTQQPDSYFPARLAKFPMVSMKAMTANRTAADPWAKKFFNTNAVGTGAYTFEGWQPGVQISLKKNTKWWKGGWLPGSIDQVTIKPVVESATRVQLIQSGQADFCTQWTINDAESTGARPGFFVQRYKTASTSPCFFMNTQKAPLDNQLVRQALVAAFDYDAMAKYYHGQSVATGGVFPPFHPNADPSLKPFKQDLTKARSLLSKAGVDPKSITINYLAPAEYPDLVAAAAIAQSSFQQIGITVKIQSIPYSQVLAAYSNPNTAGMMTAINNSPYTLDPTVFMAAFLPDYSHFNFYNLKMNDVISLISQIKAETDTAKRQKLLNKVQAAINTHAPVIFGATPRTLIPVRTYIWNYTMQQTDYRYPTLFYGLRIAAH